MAAPMQIHLLLMLLSGYFIVKQEVKYGVLSIYHNRPMDSLLVISAIVISHLIYGMVLFFGYSLIYGVFFWIDGVVSITYFFAFVCYLFLFWYVLWVFFFLVGMVLGLAFKENKLAFLAALLVWVMLAPLNSMIFEEVLPPLFKLYPEISIGHYMFLQGFSFGFEPFALLLMIMIVFAGFLVYFFQRFKGFVPRFIFVGLIVAIVGATVVYGSPDLASKDWVEREEVDVASLSTDYDIQSIDINVHDDDSLLLEVKVTIEMEKEANELDFYLEEEFIVQKVILNGKNVNAFSHEGILLSLQPETEVEGEVEIILEYKHEDGGNQNGVMFASTEAWLPVKPIVSPVVVEGHFLHNHLVNTNEVLYSVTYNGDKQLFTSLSNAIGSEADGTSKEGMALMIGDLKETSSKHGKIIHPQVLRSMPEGFEKHLNHRNRFLTLLETDLALLKQQTGEVDKVVVPYKDVTTLIGSTLYVPVYSTSYHDYRYFEYNSHDMQAEAMRLLFPDGFSDQREYKMQELLTTLVVQYDQQKYEQEEVDETVLYSDLYFLLEGFVEYMMDNPDQIAIVRSFESYYEQLNEEEKRLFIQTFYHEFELVQDDWHAFDETLMQVDWEAE
ncbi:hypothetical protein [Bacillus sp. JCM 19041]|uniref:hypothetical protein n=1 Tax=Bacillus sp. JCM 19041 TaxID=1460637 RepID=UPI0006D216FC